MNIERYNRYNDVVELLKTVDPDLPLYMEETIKAVLPANIIIEIMELIIALEKNNMNGGIDLYKVQIGINMPDERR